MVKSKSLLVWGGLTIVGVGAAVGAGVFLGSGINAYTAYENQRNNLIQATHRRADLNRDGVISESEARQVYSEVGKKYDYSTNFSGLDNSQLLKYIEAHPLEE